MKIKNSLKALKARHRDNRLVRRKGRVYIINKQNPRIKARQGRYRQSAPVSAAADQIVDNTTNRV